MPQRLRLVYISDCAGISQTQPLHPHRDKNFPSNDGLQYASIHLRFSLVDSAHDTLHVSDTAADEATDDLCQLNPKALEESLWTDATAI